MTPETKIKIQVKEYLAMKRILFWSNLAGIGRHKGLPDLFALHLGKLYGIEIKSARGVLSDYQKEFFQRLKKAGGVPVETRSLEDVMKWFEAGILEI